MKLQPNSQHNPIDESPARLVRFNSIQQDQETHWDNAKKERLWPQHTPIEYEPWSHTKKQCRHQADINRIEALAQFKGCGNTNHIASGNSQCRHYRLISPYGKQCSSKIGKNGAIIKVYLDTADLLPNQRQIMAVKNSIRLHNPKCPVPSTLHDR